MLRRRIIQGADALALTAAATRVTVASAASAIAGIVFHQREKGLLYARTSAGGAYRFDPATNAWGPLLDQLSRSDADLGGSAGDQGTGERLQVDPHQSDTLYLGTTRDRLMKSTDRGASFSKLLAPDPLEYDAVYIAPRGRGVIVGKPAVAP